MLTEAEFNQVLATMLGRYRASAPETLLAVPNLVGLLYGWQQGAGNDEAREWVQAQTQTVRGLLKFLSSARGWRQINDRTYYPLQRRELGNFLDYDAALQRLRLVSAAPETAPEDRQTALALLEAADADRDL